MTPSEIFFDRTASPSQAQLDFLLNRGVSVTALKDDPDWSGLPIGVAKVERVGARFDFLEDGTGAYVVAARDLYGEVSDFVCWAPREGWFAAHYGDLPLLGMQNLTDVRLDPAVPVFRGVLSWLRGFRDGLVILDESEAWRALEGVTVQAESSQHAYELRRMLRAPEPRVLVKPSEIGRAAA